MTLTCAHPRNVTLHTGSQETVSFLSDTLAGGIGVSIGAPGAPTANLGDGAGLETTHPLVIARVGEDLRRNGQTGTTAGNLTLQHTFTSGVMEPLRVEGGPGQYRVSVDRATVDDVDLYGFIVGLRPVEMPATFSEATAGMDAS